MYINLARPFYAKYENIVRRLMQIQGQTILHRILMKREHFKPSQRGLQLEG